MNTALWIVQILLAILFSFTGVGKLINSKEQISLILQWVNDFSPAAIKAIGVVEVLGVLGLILPSLTRILPWLTPLAAVGLMIDMVVAGLVHLRLGETALVILTIVVFILAGFIAYGRFVLVPIPPVGR
jgi:uncharacterized membrane protein YphA (DoxX/SURF4 family)